MVMVKKATKEAIILICISVGIAFTVYFVRTDKIGHLPSAVLENPTQLPSTTGDAGIFEISVLEAFRLFENHRAVFADARHSIDYEAGHIRGAINLHPLDREIWLSEFKAANDPTITIVTYCDGEDCQLAPELAQILFFEGFDNVRYLKNGWSLWCRKGHPID